MNFTRRSFLAAAAAGAAFGAKPGLRRLKIGVTDWNLQQAGNVEAVALAKSLGFDGVEVSLGRRPVDNRLPLDNAEAQAAYLAAVKEQRFSLAGTCLDILHVNYLKNDKLGQKWVADGIGVTRKLNAKVMLLPFFGKGALETTEDKNYVGDALRDLAPAAEKAGILLGLENTISAEDNVRIMDRARSSALKVYYDIGNSTLKGFDVLKEIPWLGKDRICQFHLKDNPNYLGQGKIDIPGVIQAIAGLRFEGFANLETAAPSRSVDADMRKNLGYIRNLMA